MKPKENTMPVTDTPQIATPKTEEATANKSKPQVKSGPLFRDIREYLAELARRSPLINVKRLMNKDTELMPLVRWQFRGLDESQRKGWLFENVTDSRGRKFDGSVAVAIEGGSPEMYAVAMGVKSPSEINAKWLSAMANPIQPVEVPRDRSPVKEVVITGPDIVKSGGIDQFPVTVTNPGTDVSAYYSAPIWVFDRERQARRNI
jgi:4-hydroxy-3-polyprenylbenzoate decarboxylase